MNNVEFKIEKNVPLPEGKVTGYVGIFRKMEIGDSIVVPVKYMEGAYQTAKYASIKISVKRISISEARIWRIS